MEKNEIIKAIFETYELPESAMAPARVKYLEGWLKKYQFQGELYIYACELTMQKWKYPNNKYTESLLNQWKMKGIQSVEDVKNTEVESRKTPMNSHKGIVKQNIPSKTTSEASGTRMFRNFTERQNNNYMEKILQKYRNGDYCVGN